ncbi:glycosyltransferase [Shigella flexneri]|nr:glycosyltransferase [Shigella flexneri]
MYRESIKRVYRTKTNFKFEVIIGDDCSNDDTPEIIKKYVERNPELFIFIQRSENVGPRENVNSLCKIARGRYLVFNEGMTIRHLHINYRNSMIIWRTISLVQFVFIQ